MGSSRHRAGPQPTTPYTAPEPAGHADCSDPIGYAGRCRGTRPPGRLPRAPRGLTDPYIIHATGYALAMR
jgi:hypothetical protein